jgi:hypothetical protein
VGVERFRAFVADVRRRMPANPYHNFFHVADVTQSVYCLGLRRCGPLRVRVVK